MLKVSVGDAKNRLPYYLHLVEDENEEIQITRHGKTVAYINGKEMLGKAEKKNKFLAGIDSWRQKNAEWLLTSEEVDNIFAREKDDDFSVRHPEDFSQ